MPIEVVCWERGVPQVLASATLADVLERQMTPQDLRGAFAGVLSITDPYRASKAEVIAEWIVRTGADPERMLLVGDTNHDRDIARSLGAQFVHCSFGHQELADAESIDSLTDVLELL